MKMKWTSMVRLSFARQFLVVSFIILVVGNLTIGTWVTQDIETRVTRRTAAMASVFIDSFLSPFLQDLEQGEEFSEQQLILFDELLSEAVEDQQIVSSKVWTRNGKILYSTNDELIGKVFPISSDLELALNGTLTTEISDLLNEVHAFERQRYDHLVETYAPIRSRRSNSIIGVLEIYQTTDLIEHEIQAAQWASWTIVSLATFAMYALLVGLVARASNTITTQEQALKEKVNQLSALLAQNEQLHSRVQRAVARAPELNERFLRRIAADIHDGAVQDLGLALLRLEPLAEVVGNGDAIRNPDYNSIDDVRTIQTALNSAMADLRALSAGLRLPELEQLSLAEVAERAVRDFLRKTGASVELTQQNMPSNGPLPVKITLYRLLQEALTNGFRHAGGKGQQVTLTSREQCLDVTIADTGPGFDQAIEQEGHLGLVGMKERIEILGGIYNVRSEKGKGTTIYACLPLVTERSADE
jgi:signal transduction histidine kinase